MERRESDTGIVACYREFEPHVALRSAVRALFSFTPRADPVPPARRVTFEVLFRPGDRYFSPLFADASCSIVFDVGAIASPEGTQCDSAGVCRGWVIGVMRRVVTDASRRAHAMVGAYLRPGQLSAFVRTPSAEMTDSIAPLEELWGTGAFELYDRLTTSSDSGRLDVVERALLRRTTSFRGSSTSIDVHGVAAHAVREGGRVSVELLARAAGVSRQHLARVFQERVGVSPKLFCRLTRFQSALAHARLGDRARWARVASELGYADQSHMIAEFREFSGLTPHALATEGWFHPFIERAKLRVRCP